MGEAAALSPDEPLRRDVEAEIARSASWAREEWQALLREDECLRAQLRVVAVPDHLEPRLLALLDAAAQRGRWTPLTRWLTVAAAALLVVGLLVTPDLVHSSRLRTVALLAINNHVNDHHVSVETQDAGELGRILSRELPFDVVVPELGEAFELSGGRKCKLGTHPVAYSFWTGPGGKCSLFQYRPGDFELPSGMPRRVVHAKPPAVRGEPRSVVLWADGARGYVLVGAGEGFDRLLQDRERKSE